MRTEELMNDSKLYDREGQCYLHVEKPGSETYTVICAGDPAIIMQGVYNVLCLLEQEHGVPYEKLVKMLKRAPKVCGKHVPISKITEEDEEEAEDSD